VARQEKSPEERKERLERLKEIAAGIGEKIRTQDNRSTINPMFCVQSLEADPGYEVGWFDKRCWLSLADGEWVFDLHPGEGDPDFDPDEEADEGQGDFTEYSYQTRWVDQMITFTEDGCKEYLEENGHNIRASAFKGEVRIYAKSFFRCQEMIDVRRFLLQMAEAKILSQGESE